MAIQFSKGILHTNLLFSFNNNIVRFNSDNPIAALKAEIIGLGIDVVLYPHPDGSFYFNFKDYMSSLINVDNYKDDMTVPVSIWNYDWSSKIYLQNTINFKITIKDNTIEELDISLNWLSAYCQLDNKEILPIDTAFILTPKTNQKPTLKYWTGYPFDFTFYSGIKTANLKVSNLDIGSMYLTNYIFSRIIISNGLNEMPMVSPTGISRLSLIDEVKGVLIDIEKINPNCDDKHYLKWINRYGGWNYWLFNKGRKNLNPKGLGEVNNDFNNIEDTLSQTLNIGVSSEKSIIVNDDVNDIDMAMLNDLFESPKIYIFTGKPNTVSDFSKWLEVNFKYKSVKIQDSKHSFINIQAEFEYPKRVTRTI